MRERKSYTTDDKQRALKAFRETGSISQAARDTGYPLATVSRWVERDRRAVAQAVDATKAIPVEETKDGRRKYPESVKVAAVLALEAGETLKELEQRTGIPDATLADWREGKGVPSLAVEAARKPLADKLEEWAEACVDAGPDKIGAAGLAATAVAAEKAIKAAQLLRGLPTQIAAQLRLDLGKLSPDERLQYRLLTCKARGEEIRFLGEAVPPGEPIQTRPVLALPAPAETASHSPKP